ncbi:MULTISPECIES: MHYT domain-containing protein [Pseudorhizobium]|jgi:NO-binding membrane sensor protein with MHYT domain|uniref:NO-binding membrane sensor protein with MHYT domain n=2 Tax=Pseudorhizobium TaxID=1903858 RepID=A0A7W9YZP2_9HYPH|nr:MULTISPECIES: MHYT domain-containing protein [Pseudorhizobium]MBB6180541.1 NO-binding membrane sensor protein with MHYT domain [Pseudorhizobium flavum]CAD6595881.1 carbon monoxide dehydrogenase [Pseudorhizobium flavum]CAD7048070.1 carbon monoxide dehydrogenase [Pseudorhizobium halotolerans]
MLAPNYDLVLVFASIAVSIMASFTGLTLTRGINALPDVRRKFMIVMASMALGGGIWSMHFVAMLAMSLPVPISYDAISTLGSALIAILMCGIAILIMHYVGRTWIHTAVAGTILGNGIVVMHYVGMSGIRGCLPTFELPGVVLAVLGATAMGIVALRISYVRRSTGHIFLGAIIFGLSVVLVHFVAVGWTGFRVGEGSGDVAPLIDNGILALLVMLSAFVICGTFLLTATNFVLVGTSEASPSVSASAPVTNTPKPQPETNEAQLPEHGRLPYERDKRIYFVEPSKVAAIRAEGHYSIIYTSDEKLFCPLSISVIEKRLDPQQFLRTHRSYLVNIEQVAAFERAKDNGRCLFEGVASLKSAPVSRAFVPRVRSALSI